MNTLLKIGFFLVTVTPALASAVMCSPLSIGPSQKVFEIAARSGAKANLDALSCTLTNDKKLNVKGVVSSSIARGRGFVTVSFFSGTGKKLTEEKSAPFVGQFENHVFAHTFKVPDGAEKAVISTAISSQRADASGKLSLRDVVVSRSADLSLEIPNDGVAVQGQRVVWSIRSPATVRTQPMSLTIRDVEGKPFRSISIKAGAGNTALDLGVLPVGYYDVELAIPGEEGDSSRMTHSLAIIPSAIPRDRRIGLDTALSWYGGSSEEKKKAIRLLQIAGVGSVRDRLSWSQVQARADSATWGKYQQTAELFDEAGFDVLQVFHDAPVWARSVSSSKDRTPPTPEAAFAFGQAFARDLGKSVKYIEYWNEQNTAFFHGYPYQYAASLKAFYRGIKSVDPDVQVLIGSAAGIPGRFFEDSFKNNVYPFYDIYNQHYYASIDRFSQFVSQNVAPFQGRDTAPRKSAWLTEVGYSLKRSQSGSWTEAEYEQARHLVKAYAEGFANGYERVFYFFLRELIEGDFHTWGILREDFSPRPAYVALAVLSKHLANAPLHGVMRSKNMTAVYFRDPKGGFKAVVWGKGGIASAGRYAYATDLFGRALPRSFNLDRNPVLLSSIKQLPRGVIPVKTAPRAAATSKTARLTADVYVNGERVNPQKNDLFVEVTDGSTLEVRGKLISDEGTSKGRGSLSCKGGEGVSIQQPVSLSVRLNAGGDVNYQCKYRVDLAKAGESFVEVETNGEFGRDAFYVRLKQDIADPTTTPMRTSELWPAQQCAKWVGNASPNVKMQISPLSSGEGFCSGATIAARIVKTGETWVFPFITLSSSALSAAKGLEIKVAKAPGSPLPPTPFMVQLRDKDGGIWLLELKQKKIDADEAVWYGLLNLAKPSSWAKPKSAKMAKESIQRIMFGWGGFGGQKDQGFSYSVRSINALDAR